MKPNVIIIYADDLGYGDLSCYGAEDIKTPNIDALAEEGVRFQQAYSTSSVCTPARYGLLTGQYPFSNNQIRILPGNAQHCLISKEQITLPKMFKAAEYNTAVIGKWHLGLGDGAVDWNGYIEHTPNDIGFDYSFIFPGTNDRVPTVFVKNHHVDNLDADDPMTVFYGAEDKCSFIDQIDTYKKDPDKLRITSTHGHSNMIVNGVGRIGYMKGGKAAIWKDEELTDTFLTQAKEFMDSSDQAPFFLYFAAHQPHVPRLANPKFVGATEMGPRGDVIAEFDYTVGEIVAYLKEKNLLEDTIIIISSDNGPVFDDGYNDHAFELAGKHKPAGPFRAGKYSKYEGGVRIPFILSWKGHTAKTISPAIVSQVDLLASFANLINVDVADVDSLNMLNAFMGKDSIGRSEVMFENNDKVVMLRQNQWVFLPRSAQVYEDIPNQRDFGNGPEDQLFNLDFDIKQQDNVAKAYPTIVNSMRQTLAEYGFLKATL
ncbi:sulfatase family protein [Candidatus Epulonipiscium viviparus]|uniref:sulfatase family protein n=1 Tax=Candidatus Epulonipiscium viviparus TaxID=420336 RepID=UPI0027380EED|nr:arylsulfatase [Candidatus Epulopiscium viviparus]